MQYSLRVLFALIVAVAVLLAFKDWLGKEQIEIVNESATDTITGNASQGLVYWRIPPIPPKSSYFLYVKPIKTGMLSIEVSAGAGHSEKHGVYVSGSSSGGRQKVRCLKRPQSKE